MKEDLSTNYRITNDYSYTVKGDPNAPKIQFGGATQFDRTFSFKKGEIVRGNLDNERGTINVRVGNVHLNIPRNNWELIEATTIIEKPSEVNSTPQSAIEYYTDPKTLKLIAVSAVPIGLIAYYCHYKKLSPLKTAIYVGIPIVAITFLSNLGMSARTHSYWSVYLPPSLKKSA